MRNSIERVLWRYFDPRSTATKRIAIEIEAVLEDEGWIKMEKWIEKNETDSPEYIYESPDDGKTVYRREFGKDRKERIRV